MKIFLFFFCVKICGLKILHISLHHNQKIIIVMSDFPSAVKGLGIYKGDWEGAQWTLTGIPSSEQLGHQYATAYDFEDAVKRNVNCSGIEFDSEYSQFFAYAKTRARLESFAKQIAKHYEKAKELREKMY
jgi:hypothetical protein